MNNNYNPNGQFDGWGQPGQFENMSTPPYDYRQPQYTATPGYFEQQQEKKKDRKILKIIGALCGFSIVLYFLLSVVSGAVLAAIFDKLNRVDVIYGDGLGTWALSTVMTILFIGVPFGITHFILKAKKITGILPLGTTYNKKASTYLIISFLPLTLVSTFMINFISIMAQSAMGVDFESGMEGMTITSVKEFVFGTIFIAVVPAILEEITIRGILLQPLRRYGDWFAIVVSSVIFSLLHGNMVQVPYTIVAGMYFGYVAVATGSIWPSIILHFCNNFYSILITTFDSNLSTPVANVTTIATLAIMVVAGIFAFTKFKSMNYKVKKAKGIKTLKTGEKIKAVFLNFPMVIAIIMMIVTTLTSVSKT